MTTKSPDAAPQALDLDALRRLAGFLRASLFDGYGPYADHVDAAVAEVEKARQGQATLDDLAMLTRKLVRSLRMSNPHSDLAARAVDYLQRKGLQGSPLRIGADEQPRIPVPRMGGDASEDSDLRARIAQLERSEDDLKDQVKGRDARIAELEAQIKDGK